MTGVRWGFTFLMGNSLISNEDKLNLVAEATLLYLKGGERTEVSGDGFEGILYTNMNGKSWADSAVSNSMPSSTATPMKESSGCVFW